MSERDLARHRSAQRPVTFLSDAGEAVTGRLAVVSRSSAVLAVSTGMLATGGLPIQTVGTEAAVTLASAPVSATTSNVAAVNGLRSPYALSDADAWSASAPLTAPMAATVSFETSSFRAAPAPVRPAVTAVATHRTTAPAHAAPAHAAPAKAAPVKAAPAKTTPAQAARAKAAPVKAAPAKAAPARKGSPRHPASAPAKPHPDVERPPTPSKHVQTPAKPSLPAPSTPKKPPAAKPSAPKKSTPSAARGSDVLAVAARYVGTPYRYGGTTPRGFDCSGYVGYVYRQLGISLPRTANQQMGATRRITRSQARAGDLVFFVSAGRAYHVAIYAGHNQIYDAPHTGKTVQKRTLWTSAVVYGRVAR